MLIDEALWLAILFFLIAILYSCVGQAGASGYLAAMGLFGLAPELMKPTALALNVLVSGIGTVQFWRRGLLAWKTFYPFAILGFPFSLLGGAIHLPQTIYYPAIGTILILSGIQMLRFSREKVIETYPVPKDIPFLPALFTGALIGIVSGMTGTGGGIFLAPVILSMRWIEMRHTAAVTAVYNLLNSAAALLGASASLHMLPIALPYWLIAVGIGGIIGSIIGSRSLSEPILRKILAFVLFLSGAKLMFT